jgi:hypothetical protein
VSEWLSRQEVTRTVQPANVRTASRMAKRALDMSPGVLWQFFFQTVTAVPLEVHERSPGGKAKNEGIIFLSI